MEEDLVTLVDTRDTPLGEIPKLQAHLTGQLHRAISVFIFDRQGRTLLQRRAAGKYHSAGLWSNTCCTHPRPGETTLAAATRRLAEEMGLSCELRFRFSFLYRAELDAGLVEHELDHVFTGFSTSDPQPNPEEVGEWRWVRPDELLEEIRAEPRRFTAWLPLALDRVLNAASMDEPPVPGADAPIG